MRFGILRQPITLGEAVQQTPAGGGATAFSTIFGAVRNVVGGLFGVITVLLLTFYMLVESREIRSFFVRLFPRRERVACRGNQRDGDRQGERVAGRPASARRSSSA